MFRDEPFGDNKRNNFRDVFRKDIAKYERGQNSAFKEELELFGGRNGLNADLADYVEGLWDGLQTGFAKDNINDKFNEIGEA